MSSLQKLSLTLQRSQSASSLLPLATPPRDNALHLWGQKDGIPPSEVTFSEQQPGLREGFVLLSKEEPKQQQSEPESLISVQPPQLVLESDTTAEHYNEQYDSRATSEEQTVYSDDSGEDSAPEEPLNNSVDEVSILKRLGLQREFYTEKEVETAFVHLSLAFKSDMFTLKQRLDVEERARDVAEENIQKELEGCRIILQEARVSGGVQVMMEHVANLKSIHAKEHAELQEMKKIIQQNSRSRQFGDMRDDANFQTKHQMMRAMHQSTARRRVSIAVIPKQLVTFHIPDSKAADSEECRMDYSCTKITKHNVPLQNSRLRHPHEDSIGNYAQCLASNSNQPRPPSQRCEIKSEEISFHGSECKRNLKGKANWKSSRSGEAPISLSNTWKCICLRQNQEQKVGGILKKETLNRETETETESEDEDGYTSDTMSNASLMLEQQSPLSGLSCFLDSYQKILTSVVLTLIVAWLLQPKSFWFWP
ncbi:inositol 1,4,5-triphosphate receptor associated 1-like isoform X3 [Rhincodon typus]|uniref:inositol 1,4,5-triphosphate receptor associated 1-like isoform X3 n=1 Tax=Rhincodon typus TaxID=259920 RepID=UPI0020306BBC|nr:inositol 1,4,5-triphosphate receptor associated 1-like isoform X3 [Rhincodon typus]